MGTRQADTRQRCNVAGWYFDFPDFYAVFDPTERPDAPLKSSDVSLYAHPDTGAKRSETAFTENVHPQNRQASLLRCSGDRTAHSPTAGSRQPDGFADV